MSIDRQYLGGVLYASFSPPGIFYIPDSVACSRVPLDDQMMHYYACQNTHIIYSDASRTFHLSFTQELSKENFWFFFL